MPALGSLAWQGLSDPTFNNTLFTVTTIKASNMAISVPTLINFIKLRCPVIHNHHNFTFFGVGKGVESFGKQ